MANDNNNNIVSSDQIIIRAAVAAIDIESGTEQELKMDNLNVMDEDNAQYIVDFLQRHSTAVNKLYICCNQWSAQAVEIFRAYFVSTTTLDKINLRRGRLGNANCGRLLSGLHGNMCVSKLYLRYNVGLEGAAGGRHLSALLQNNTQLKELRCGSFSLGPHGARALQTSLRTNQSLQALLLRKCRLGDEGMAAITNALNGNNTIQVLSIENNHLTSNSLPHVIRLLQHESLQLLILDQNPELFANSNNENTAPFTNALSSLNKLKILSINLCQLPSHVLTALFVAASIDDTSLSELNVYDMDQVSGQQTLEQLLEIIPKMSSSVRRLHINLDYTSESVQSSFHWNTNLTHLYNGMNRTKISRKNSNKNVEPLLRILKRNQKIHYANELLLLSNHHYHDVPPSNIPKGVWTKALSSLAHDHTGATAVYKIMRAKLVMWWAPKKQTTTSELNGKQSKIAADAATRATSCPPKSSIV